MFRYAIKIEYDGSPFNGWQIQKNQLTVQGIINQAISNLDNSSNGITGAGRTDAGVHSLGQVGHVDFKKEWEPKSLINALSYHMKPYPIAITHAARVTDDFHARFSAIKRQYIYKFLIRKVPQIFNRSRFWVIRNSLNTLKMQKASDFLIGTHDFQTFRSSLCQARSSIKTIDKIEINSSVGHMFNDSEEIISLKIEARSFLHNQVRSIAGTLFKIGNESWDVRKMKDILDLKERQACGPVAPPTGLYLQKVEYKCCPFKS